MMDRAKRPRENEGHQQLSSTLKELGLKATQLLDNAPRDVMDIGFAEIAQRTSELILGDQSTRVLTICLRLHFTALQHTRTDHPTQFWQSVMMLHAIRSRLHETDEHGKALCNRFVSMTKFVVSNELSSLLARSDVNGYHTRLESLLQLVSQLRAEAEYDASSSMFGGLLFAIVALEAIIDHSSSPCVAVRTLNAMEETCLHLVSRALGFHSLAVESVLRLLMTAVKRQYLASRGSLTVGALNIVVASMRLHRAVEEFPSSATCVELSSQLCACLAKQDCQIPLASCVHALEFVLSSASHTSANDLNLRSLVLPIVKTLADWMKRCDCDESDTLIINPCLEVIIHIRSPLTPAATEIVEEILDVLPTVAVNAILRRDVHLCVQYMCHRRLLAAKCLSCRDSDGAVSMSLQRDEGAFLFIESGRCFAYHATLSRIALYRVLSMNPRLTAPIVAAVVYTGSIAALTPDQWCAVACDHALWRAFSRMLMTCHGSITLEQLALVFPAMCSSLSKSNDDEIVTVILRLCSTPAGLHMWMTIDDSVCEVAIRCLEDPLSRMCASERTTFEALGVLLTTFATQKPLAPSLSSLCVVASRVLMTRVSLSTSFDDVQHSHTLTILSVLVAFHPSSYALMDDLSLASSTVSPVGLEAVAVALHTYPGRFSDLNPKLVTSCVSLFLSCQSSMAFSKLSVTLSMICHASDSYVDDLIRCDPRILLNPTVHCILSVFHRHAGSDSLNRSAAGSHDSFLRTLIRQTVDFFADSVSVKDTWLFETARTPVLCSLVARCLILPVAEVASALMDTTKLIRVDGLGFLATMVESHFSTIVVSLLARVSLMSSASLSVDSINASCASFQRSVGYLCLIENLAHRAVSLDSLSKHLQSALPSTDVSRQRVLKCLFDVVHTLWRRMHLESESGYECDTSKVLAPSTTKYWSTSLLVLLRFLGRETVRIISKVPALLQFGCTSKTLALNMALTIREAIAQLPTEYIVTNVPTLIAEVVAVETALGSANTSISGLLQETITRLYDATRSSHIWFASRQLLINSPAVESVTQAIGGTRIDSPDKVRLLFLGFQCALETPSGTCREIFIRSMCSFLREACFSLRQQCSAFIRSDEGTSVLRALLAFSATAPSPQCTAMLGECLGLIGSMPVERACGAYNASNTITCVFQLHHLFDWRELLRTLLGDHCLRALGAASEGHAHDKIALAVQELLRLGVCRERRDANRLALADGDRIFSDELEQYSWWKLLEPLAKTALIPFAATKYVPVVKSQRQPKVPEFVAGSQPLEWLFAWYCNLAQKVQKSFIGSVASATRNAAKHDIRLLETLLPHLVVAAILDPGITETPSSVAVEFSAVLASQSEAHIAHALVLMQHLENLMWTSKRISFKLEAPRPGFSQADATDFALALQKFFDESSLPILRRAQGSLSGKSHCSTLRALDSFRYLPSINKAKEQHGDAFLELLHASLVEVGDKDTSAYVSSLLTQHGAANAFHLERDGRYAEARDVAESVLQYDPSSVSHQLCLLRCLKHLGETHLLHRYAVATRDDAPSMEHKSAVSMFADDAAWKLGEWERIDCTASNPSSLDDVSLAIPIVSLMRSFGDSDKRKGMDGDGVARECAILRTFVLPAVGLGLKESAAKVAAPLGILHALADIETVAVFLGKLDVGADDLRGKIYDLFSFLKQRLGSCDPLASCESSLFHVHRAVFSALGYMDLVSQLWVSEARLLRKLDKPALAMQCIQRAQYLSFVDSRLHTETAKIRYVLDKEKGVQFAQVNATREDIDVNVRAKLKLCALTWSQEMATPTDASKVIEAYGAILRTPSSSSRKAHLQLAQFLDQQFQLATPKRAGSTTGAAPSVQNAVSNTESLVLPAIGHYFSAVRLGVREIHAALSRVMTMWFDSIGALAAIDKPKQDALISKLNAVVEKNCVGESAVPFTSLMIVLPQLLSRISHTHLSTGSVIHRIIGSLLVACPQQTLWALFPVSRTCKEPRRASAAKDEILSLFQARGKAESRAMESFSLVFNVLLNICNDDPKKFNDPLTRLSQEPHVKKYERALASCNCVLPISACLLPDWTLPGASRSIPSAPTLVSFADKVDIMSSLQRPKRIGIVGSDGIEYPFLCKAKDDPRKDIRMMELVALMNRVFTQAKGSESERRRFSLRPYVVAALDDDHAIIEWVSNQGTLRRLVEDTYQLDGTGIKVQPLAQQLKTGKISRADLFALHILPNSKPVFHQWFLQTFIAPSQWLEARSLYVRSCAVWSAVGHMVGLGDRHGENLLIDHGTGEIMHVDFACMFDRGESLQEPERVRFRLTPNVVDAMGITGTNGAFRTAFEIALRTQVKNKNAIMAVLETLLHDPLIEWSSQAKTDPRTLFQRIRRRLDGFLDLKFREKIFDSAPHDIETQTTMLINHATSPENLQAMYIWWMAWI